MRACRTVWSSRTARAPVQQTRPSPCRARIGALQVLHLAQQMTEMLAVHSILAARAEWRRSRDLERGLLEHRQNGRRPRRLQRAPSRTESVAKRSYVGFVFAEEL